MAKHRWQLDGDAPASTPLCVRRTLTKPFVRQSPRPFPIISGLFGRYPPVYLPGGPETNSVLPAPPPLPCSLRASPKQFTVRTIDGCPRTASKLSRAAAYFAPRLLWRPSYPNPVRRRASGSGRRLARGRPAQFRLLIVTLYARSLYRLAACFDLVPICDRARACAVQIVRVRRCAPCRRPPRPGHKLMTPISSALC